MNLPGVGATPDMRGLLGRHAVAGMRVAGWLRGGLVLFLAATMIGVPPRYQATWCWVIVGLYAVAAVAIAVWVRLAPAPAGRHGWVLLFLDLSALSAFTVVASVSAAESWTPNVALMGFFVLPLIAATDLRPTAVAILMVPTVVVYLMSAITARVANDEPWASVLLRGAALALAAVGAWWLSRLQHSRVSTIATLAQQRGELVAELVGIEERERRELAEHLHDGALQYLLAARMDVEDLPETAERARLDVAITESARLLRSTVSQLHPAVLSAAGLPAALRTLATGAADRLPGGVAVEVTNWPDDLRTHLDGVIFAAARELLGNVTKHAGAQQAWISLVRDGHTARLTLRDNGVGVDEALLRERRSQGHVGLASQEARVAAAGGRLILRPGGDGPNGGGGTVAVVELPLTEAR